MTLVSRRSAHQSCRSIDSKISGVSPLPLALWLISSIVCCKRELSDRENSCSQMPSKICNFARCSSDTDSNARAASESISKVIVSVAITEASQLGAISLAQVKPKARQKSNKSVCILRMRLSRVSIHGLIQSGSLQLHHLLRPPLAFMHLRRCMIRAKIYCSCLD